MERRGFRRGAAAVLALILWTALLVRLGAGWTQRQFEVPPAWDHAMYLSMSLHFHRSFEEGGALALGRQILREPSAAAPLFPLTTAPFYGAFGESRETAQLTLGLYLFLLLLGTALLSAALGASPKAIVLSVFLVSTFAGVVNFSREYMMDLPAAATATLALAALARREGSVVAGVLAGITLLTKVLAGVFFVGPVVYGLLHAERRKVLLFVLAALATASLWYAPRFVDIYHYIGYYGFGEGSLPFQSSSHPGYYARILATQGIGWLPLGALGAALLLGRRARPTAFLLVWIACGYTLLTLLPNKGGERYVLALLPPIAVIGAMAIANVESTAFRSGLTVLALTAGMVNYAGVTWESPLSSLTHDHFDVFPHAMPLEEHERSGWPTREVLKALEELRPSRAQLGDFIEGTKDLDDPRFVQQAYRFFLAREADAQSLEAYVASLRARSRTDIAEEILRSEELRDRPLRVLVVPDHRVFNPATLRYLAELEKLALLFQRPVRGDEPADGAVVKEGGPQGPWPQALASPSVASAVESRGETVGSYPCPDGSRVLVLRLRP